MFESVVKDSRCDIISRVDKTAFHRSGTMAATKPLYGKEEFARRGEAIYRRDIEPVVGKGNEGCFVAIDIESREYEIDADETAASDRLLARVPNAQTWVRRIGSPYIRRFGPSHREAS
jgi:hypothetical protein